MDVKKTAQSSKAVSKPKTVSGKGGSGNLSLSEIIQVRLDPKLRWAIELAIRGKKRAASSFVEWAIGQAVKSAEWKSEGSAGLTIKEAADRIWDEDESKRFVNLANVYPKLLTPEEKVLWKHIRDLQFCWQTKADINKGLDVTIDAAKINFQILRSNINLIKKFADGDINKSTLITHLRKYQIFDSHYYCAVLASLMTAQAQNITLRGTRFDIFPPPLPAR